ncbi:hypothetical protein ACHHYP_01240 [Achlya hypogyna]|uniref:EDRF1 N-terminal domain-containing protein n=1 Tax=Achlya hypogyna TaxID=1202772 RepID=A0A1V9Z910_ACHHY|nr:hypothetical protein ACHHYP_01240 [Achlya hypogyna]
MAANDKSVRGLKPLASLHLPDTTRLDLTPVTLSDCALTTERITKGGPSDETSMAVDQRVYARQVLSSRPPLHLPEAMSSCSGWGVDVVSSTDTIKQVFAMPYHPGNSSSGVAIHRVGNTLVMESAIDRLRRRREQGLMTESRKITQRYKRSKDRLSIEQPQPDCSPSLFSSTSPSVEPSTNATSSAIVNPQDDLDDDAHSDCDVVPGYELVADSETGEIFLLVQEAPAPEAKAQTSYHQVLHDRFLHDDLSRATLPLAFPAPSEHLVHWQFDSMEMLLGSNSLLFQHAPSGDSVGVALREAEAQWTSLACLDVWLDQVIHSLQRAALGTTTSSSFCLVHTDDLPFLGGPATALFDPATIFSNAQSILRFLQAHCVDEATTYWLTQSAAGLYLFKLPSDVVTSMYASASVDHTVGMLCLELAARAEDPARALPLFRQGLRLVDRRACPAKVLVSALVATAKLVWAPHMRPYTATRWLHGDLDPFERAEDLHTQLAQALEACESFASTPKDTRTLFEIAQQLLPRGAAPPKPPRTSAPPMLDDEAQQKEDLELASSLLEEAAAVAEPRATPELRDALVAVHYVLTHMALQEGAFGLALHRLHRLLALVDSFQSSQVPLLVAKVHLRLAMQPKEQTPVFLAQYAAVAAVVGTEAPLWVTMSLRTGDWAGDVEQHLNIALTAAMQVGDYSSLPHLVVGRDHVHRCFRETLRDTYVSLARHLVATGRLTKGARHAEQGVLLFSSLTDDLAVLELRIVLAEVALRAGRHHEAIGGFAAALADLARFHAAHVLQLAVHVRLLLRFAHTQHALHLQQQLANEPLLHPSGALTAARGAVRTELEVALRYAQDALEGAPQLLSRTQHERMCAWRVADTHYLLAGFLAAHAAAVVAHAAPEPAWELLDATGNHYATALRVLPTHADARVHALLLRLDCVKFWLSVGTALEARACLRPDTSPAHRRALDCLLAGAELFAPREDDEDPRVDVLVRGLFQLVEQQAHACLRHLIKGGENVAQLKACYLEWLTHGRERGLFETLKAARDCLASVADEAP